MQSTTTLVPTPTPQSSVAPFSPSSAIGLALLATALGGPMLWFAGRDEVKKKKRLTRKELARVFRMERLRSVGVLFVVGALMFTVFALLSPVFPDVKDATSSWGLTIKYVTVFSSMIGGMCLAMATLWALFELILFAAPSSVQKRNQKRREQSGEVQSWKK